MKYTYKYLFFILLGALALVACEKDEDLSDLLAKWEAPDIQPAADITVGAYYYPIFDDLNWEIGAYNMPELGMYNSEDVSTVSRHLEWSKQAGIDIWLYSWSGKESLSDTILHEIFPQVNGINDIQIAIVFEHGAVKQGTGIDFSVPEEKQKMIDEFVNLQPVFDWPNYFKIDGKPVVIIRSGNGYQPQPDLLLAGDPDTRPAAFDEVRSQVAAQTGYDVYLIGDVVDWYPPERFPSLLATFDAITPYNMHTNNKPLITRFNEVVDLSYEHWKEYADVNGIPFVTNAIPSYNDTIQVTKNNDVLPRTEIFFREQCNVAKKHMDAGLNLIFITSFNQWHEDTQVEPSPTYGNTYLDVLRQEFKLK